MVVIAMIVGLADGLSSLYVKVAPIVQAVVIDWPLPPFTLNWLPWLTTPGGLVLLWLIYRQSRMNHPNGPLPMGDPRQIPADRCIRRKVVRITDWVGEDNVLRHIIFEDCFIQGPAVLVTTGGQNHIDSPTFTGSELPVMVAPMGYKAFGAIGLDGCAFRRCAFHRVGITTDHTGATALRASVPSRS